MGRGRTILICEPRLRGLVVVDDPKNAATFAGVRFDYRAVRNSSSERGSFEALVSDQNDEPALSDGREILLRVRHRHERRVAIRAAVRAWRRGIDDGHVVVEDHGLAKARRDHITASVCSIMGAMGMFVLPIAPAVVQGRVNWRPGLIPCYLLAGAPFLALACVAVWWLVLSLRSEAAALRMDQGGIDATLRSGARRRYPWRSLRSCRQRGLVWVLGFDDRSDMRVEATWRIGAILSRFSPTPRRPKRWTLKWLFPASVLWICGTVAFGFVGVGLLGLGAWPWSPGQLAKNLLVAASGAMLVPALVPLMAIKGMRERRRDRANARQMRREPRAIATPSAMVRG